jgi:hypothetical protein
MKSVNRQFFSAKSHFLGESPGNECVSRRRGRAERNGSRSWHGRSAYGKTEGSDWLVVSCQKRGSYLSAGRFIPDEVDATRWPAALCNKTWDLTIHRSHFPSIVLKLFIVHFCTEMARTGHTENARRPE